MSDTENKEWMNIVRKYGIIMLIWLGAMVIIISIIAIMGQVENIRVSYYWDMGYIGYTIGIPLLVVYPIFYLVIAFRNNKKRYEERTKPIPIMKFTYPFFMLYLTLPIIAGFIPL